VTISREEAEARGWQIFGRDAGERELPGGLFERVPAHWRGERTVHWPSGTASSHSLAAPSLERLLDEIAGFDERVAA
jgi:hypothetical protein